MIALLTKTNMKRKVDPEIFDRSNSDDFEITNPHKSEVALAAERRDRVRHAVFFDDPYGYGNETISADVSLCTAEW